MGSCTLHINDDLLNQGDNTIVNNNNRSITLQQFNDMEKTIMRSTDKKVDSIGNIELPSFTVDLSPNRVTTGVPEPTLSSMTVDEGILNRSRSVDSDQFSTGGSYEYSYDANGGMSIRAPSDHDVHHQICQNASKSFHSETSLSFVEQEAPATSTRKVAIESNSSFLDTLKHHLETEDELSLLVAAAASALLTGEFHNPVHQAIIGLPGAPLTQESSFSTLSSQHYIDFSNHLQAPENENRGNSMGENGDETLTKCSSRDFQGTSTTTSSQRASFTTAKSTSYLSDRLSFNSTCNEQLSLSIGSTMWDNPNVWDQFCDNNSSKSLEEVSSISHHHQHHTRISPLLHNLTPVCEQENVTHTVASEQLPLYESKEKVDDALRSNAQLGSPSSRRPSCDSSHHQFDHEHIHPSALLFTSGVGGRHFSPPIVLAHPEEFRNPSSFLKVYGDPLCGLEERGMKTDKHANDRNNNVLKGKNGNWACSKCGNVNYPRRFRCNKCSEIRDAVGDTTVGEYALQVYYHHMKSYKKLGGGKVNYNHSQMASNGVSQLYIDSNQNCRYRNMVNGTNLSKGGKWSKHVPNFMMGQQQGNTSVMDEFAISSNNLIPLEETQIYDDRTSPNIQSSPSISTNNHQFRRFNSHPLSVNYGVVPCENGSMPYQHLESGIESSLHNYSHHNEATIGDILPPPLFNEVKNDQQIQKLFDNNSNHSKSNISQHVNGIRDERLKQYDSSSQVGTPCFSLSTPLNFRASTSPAISTPSKNSPSPSISKCMKQQQQSQQYRVNKQRSSKLPAPAQISAAIKKSNISTSIKKGSLSFPDVALASSLPFECIPPLSRSEQQF